MKPNELKELFDKYLYCSYCYYIQYESPITDYQYDKMCEELYNGWYNFDHEYKYLVTEDDMRAGTGYAITYPTELRLKLHKQFVEEFWSE